MDAPAATQPDRRARLALQLPELALVLPAAALKVFAICIRSADTTGRLRSSASQLAETANTSADTIRRGIDELAQLGYIIATDKRPGAVPVYVLTTPDDPDRANIAGQNVYSRTNKSAGKTAHGQPSAGKNASACKTADATPGKTARAHPQSAGKTADGSASPAFPPSPLPSPSYSPTNQKAAASQHGDTATQAEQPRKATAAGMLDRFSPTEPTAAALIAAGCDEIEAGQLIARHGIDGTAAALSIGTARFGEAPSYGRAVQLIRELADQLGRAVNVPAKVAQLTARGISTGKASELAARFSLPHIAATLAAKDAEAKASGRKISAGLLARAIEDNDGRYCPVADGIAEHRRAAAKNHAQQQTDAKTDAARSRTAELAAERAAARKLAEAVDALTPQQLAELAVTVRAAFSKNHTSRSVLGRMDDRTAVLCPLARDETARHIEAVQTGARRIVPEISHA